MKPIRAAKALCTWRYTWLDWKMKSEWQSRTDLIEIIENVIEKRTRRFHRKVLWTCALNKQEGKQIKIELANEIGKQNSFDQEYLYKQSE